MSDRDPPVPVTRRRHKVRASIEVGVAAGLLALVFTILHPDAPSWWVWLGGAAIAIAFSIIDDRARHSRSRPHDRRP